MQDETARDKNRGSETGLSRDAGGAETDGGERSTAAGGHRVTGKEKKTYGEKNDHRCAGSDDAARHDRVCRHRI